MELRYPFYRDEFSVEKYQHGEGFVIRIRKFLLFDQGVEVECLWLIYVYFLLTISDDNPLHI